MHQLINSPTFRTMRNDKNWQQRLRPANYYALFSLVLEMDDEYDRYEALTYNQKDMFVERWRDEHKRFPANEFIYSVDLRVSVNAS